MEFAAENGTTPLANTDTVGTGMKVIVKVNGVKTDTYSIVMYGDVTGDGSISVSDLAAMKIHLLKQTALTGAKLMASDVSGEGNITITDLITLKKSLLNLAVISQSR